MKLQYDENTELLIDLIIGALEEEGYEVLRYKDSKMHNTTGYDCLSVKRADGVYFTIDVEKCMDDRNPRTGEIKLAGDTYKSLKEETQDGD